MRPRKKDRHLPACVYRRHGAYWLVKAGKWMRLGSELPEALTEYARLAQRPTGAMADLIDRAIAHIEPKLAANTRAQYRLAATRLKDILAEFRPDQVLPRHVAAIKAHYATTPNMGNRILSVLRQVFALAVEWQEVDSNPCIGIRRHAEARRTRYLTDAEYQAIRQAACPTLAAIMDVAYLTGQRIGDVLGIRLADIEDGGILFQQQKTGARLRVAMTDDLRQAVTAARALRTTVKGMTLFHNRRGGRYAYGTIRDMWDRACAKAGIEDAHLHDLRAKALTDAKRESKDPQTLAGHTNPAMTQRYIRQREIPTAQPPSFGQLADLFGQKFAK